MSTDAEADVPVGRSPSDPALGLELLRRLDHVPGRYPSHKDQVQKAPARRTKVLDNDQDAIGLANTPLARVGLGGRDVRNRRTRRQPTPKDPEGEHHREHRIAQGGGLQDQPRQGNRQSQQ